MLTPSLRTICCTRLETLTFGNQEPLNKHTLVQIYFHRRCHSILCTLLILPHTSQLRRYLPGSSTQARQYLLLSLGPLWPVNWNAKLHSGESPVLYNQAKLIHSILKGIMCRFPCDHGCLRVNFLSFFCDLLCRYLKDIRFA